MEGEIAAIREIADRVDGKPGQMSGVEGDNALALLLTGLKVQLGAKLDRIAGAGAAREIEDGAG